jgi:hypothetical protein
MHYAISGEELAALSRAVEFFGLAPRLQVLKPNARDAADQILSAIDSPPESAAVTTGDILTAQIDARGPPGGGIAPAMMAAGPPTGAPGGGAPRGRGDVHYASGPPGFRY